MQVYRDIEHLPRFTNAVITIGTFDGVHAGHQQIIAQLRKEAGQINGETVIITFHPHPRKVVREGQAPVATLTTLDEKIALLKAKGINHLVIVPFTGAFASQTAEEYITDFLVAKFNPHTIIIGYDHRFGKERKGDYQLLEAFGAKLGFKVKEIPEQLLNDIIISSTRIREALLAGDVDTANGYLGYDYFFEGTVVDGNKLGRTLGYPTANLRIEDPEKLVPGDGIYAVRVEFQVSSLKFEVIEADDSPIVHRESSMGGEETSNVNHESSIVIGDTANSPNSNLQSPIANLQFKGMMSIGVRPTIGGKTRVIEVNIFNFSQNVYGKTLRVYLKKYMRGEVKFNGLEELKLQLLKDKEEALKVLA